MPTFPNAGANIPTYSSETLIPLYRFGYVSGVLYHNPDGTAVAVDSGGEGASVTAASVLTALEAMDATQEASSRAAIAAAGSAVVNDYTTPGTYTWTKPAGAKLIRVQLIGGGGGGGSGAKYPSGTETSGGAGGGGGGYAEMVFVASDVPDSVTVTVGSGGAGGAAQTTNSAAGNIGTTGGTSMFGQMLGALRPTPAGAGGTSMAASTAGSGGGGTMSGLAGGSGASGAAGGNGATQVSTSASGGGGAGGGISSAGEFRAGGKSSTWNIRGFSFDQLSATTSDGESGASAANQALCANGGSGGSSSVVGNGGNGGNGGNYGGGGGGGGSALDGVGNSGAGGNGAGGRAIITTYF